MEGRTVDSRAMQRRKVRKTAQEMVLEDTCRVLVEDFFSPSPRLPIFRFILWAMVKLSPGNPMGNFGMISG